MWWCGWALPNRTTTPFLLFKTSGNVLIAALLIRQEAQQDFSSTGESVRISPTRRESSPNGILRAPFACPAANSEASRTSISRSLI